MANQPELFFLVPLGLGLAFLVSLGADALDRQRIRENVGNRGGKVIEISREWFSGERTRRMYEVTYITPDTTRIEAKCITSMNSGVLWISDQPEGLSEVSNSGQP